MDNNIFTALNATLFTSPLGEELVILPRDKLLQLIEDSQQVTPEIEIEAIIALFSELDLAHENLVFNLSENGFHKLRAARKSRGLNQQQLASLSGLSQPLISSLENKTNEGTVESWIKIADCLDVSLNYLLK